MRFIYRNNILFTPTQVEAIRSGMQPGLTLVVGPPGTGKILNIIGLLKQQFVYNDYITLMQDTINSHSQTNRLSNRGVFLHTNFGPCFTPKNPLSVHQ